MKDNIFFRELMKCKAEIDSIISDDRFFAMMIPEADDVALPKYLAEFRKLSHGGKRIRAYLVQLGYELWAGSCDERILLPALSYEVFQTGVLIHDDIIDQSDTRRNMPSLHMALGGGHTAVSKAICVGDIGLYAAVDMVTRADYAPENVKRAIAHQIRVYQMTVTGELMDIELSEKTAYSLDEILQMYACKTSWYTMIGPMQLGAILAGADETMIDQIARMGYAMGIAFQIMDDIIGVFGDRKVIGKSNLSDMQEGKQTVLTSHFLAHADEAQLAAFRQVYGKRDGGEAEIQRVRELLREAGSEAYANALCKEYVDRAGAVLDEMQIDDRCRSILRCLQEYLCGREV
ncbi:MAG: polyprenyl synthetase family protein [Oscillospiraceae bacterium]|nr:polyprenyl synthetase family protein [Oscillospiraceae bacterium]